MLAIPAIDLIEGRCVRLVKGDFDTEQIYSENPAETARAFARMGAKRLHVVDLDAARSRGNNRQTIAAIRETFPGTLDVGGGVRSVEDALRLQDLGVDLMVLGTVLTRNPDRVSAWAARLGSVFSAGIDALDGKVKVSGWETETSISAGELARKAADLGCSEIIYTDISRDGTLSGPNIKDSLRIALDAGLPLIVSGGVGRLEDVSSLAESAPEGVRGIIIGKAFYEGKIDFSEAVRILEEKK